LLLLFHRAPPPLLLSPYTTLFRSPEDFLCWHYWGKTSVACFMGGIRLRGADPASFRVLNFAYAMDKTAVYTTSGRVPGADLSTLDRKSTRLNSSHVSISYAVFCLK